MYPPLPQHTKFLEIALCSGTKQTRKMLMPHQKIELMRLGNLNSYSYN